MGNPQASKGTVLVVGANGFLGGYIVATLRATGWNVLRGIRAKGDTASDVRDCDLACLCAAENWIPLLSGVDAVVNVAGILRESGAQRFDVIHHAAPLALAHACVEKGVRVFVQISALGHPEDGPFIASKHRFDAALLQLPLDAVVLRPSVVYAPSGSYGGTSLLRALAGLPRATVLPGDGHGAIQPVAVEDLAQLVVRAVEAPVTGMHEVGSPQPMQLRDYQLAWRRWLRIRGQRTWSTPQAGVSLLVMFRACIGNGPADATVWRMLQRGNVTAPRAWQDLQERFGFAPRALEDVLAAHPSQVQDRWQARLYLLGPVLRISLVLLWLLSAWAGFAIPVEKIETMVAGSWLEQAAPLYLARGGGALDLVLGLWLLCDWKPRGAIVCMFVSVLAYTLVFGSALPSAWLQPLGGLAKNLIVLPALWVAWVLSDRR